MLLRQAMLLLAAPPTPTTMAASTPLIEDSASPTLSSAPATAVLDRAELEIGLQTRLEGSAVSITESTTRTPKCSMTSCISHHGHLGHLGHLGHGHANAATQ